MRRPTGGPKLKLARGVAHLIHGVVFGYGRPHVDHLLVLWVVWRHVEGRRKLHAVDNICLENSSGGRKSVGAWGRD